jgi:hypothetical protein
MPVITHDLSFAGAVRIRARAIDPHEGLRGHDYIAARRLDAPVQRLDTSSDGNTERVKNILHQWPRKCAVVVSLRFGMRQNRTPQAR